MNDKVARQAFKTSVPVMAGYIVLGMGFGLLLHDAGYGALWALLMAVTIYAGTMQYVGVSLLAGAASVLTTALTTLMVQARHLFYSISMIERYKGAGKYKPYMIFGLTDETYSLLSDDNLPVDPKDAHRYRFLVTMFNSDCKFDFFIRSKKRHFTDLLEIHSYMVFQAYSVGK